MGSPMPDMPICYPIPVNAKGEGPVEVWDKVDDICWSCLQSWTQEIKDGCIFRGDFGEREDFT